MADTLAAQLPPGFVRLTGDLSFNVTKTGMKGRYTINQNDPFAVWELSVSYSRVHYESVAGARFDNIMSFFLTTGGALAFKVEDPLDNTDATMNGEGWIEDINGDGVFRATKHYTFGGKVYVHPVTRLQAGIVLSGGAAGKTIDLETGIVAGCTSPGRWTGKFYRVMIFGGSLRYETDPSGLVKAFDVPLQENLEI
jgi:hypothetical protein